MSNTNKYFQSDGSKSKIVLKLLESLVCTICHDYMYVPVMTTCGHNYCYNCISHWLVSNNATELTCPQCRSAIKEPPALNTALQQLCNMIIDELYQDNALLLETRMECTTQYKNDSNSSAMFNNVFGNTAIAVVDDDDGVARCSNCHWEVEGDVCPHCSYRMRNRVGTADENSIESDEYSEDELNELRNGNTRNLHGSVGQIYDLEAESDEDSESLSEGRGMRRQNSHNNNEEEEETDAYEREPVDSDLDSFIVDEDDGEGVELLDSDGLPEKEIHTNYGANSDTHESYDSDFYEHNDEGGFVSGDSLDDGTRSESEEHQEREEEDEDMGHQARKRRFQVVIDSDEED